MPTLLDQIISTGWRAVEAALLVVILCVLLNIITGPESGTFIASVAANATSLLQSLPAATLLGLALIVGVWWFVKLGQAR